MKNSVEARITRLVEQMAKNTTSKIRVVYADGCMEYLDAGACIDLIMGALKPLAPVTAFYPTF